MVAEYAILVVAMTWIKLFGEDFFIQQEFCRELGKRGILDVFLSRALGILGSA